MKPFVGTVSKHEFEIHRRMVLLRNSFTPILYGRFVTTDKGVRVIIRMTMHPLVTVFAGLWLGGVMIMSLLFSLPRWISTGNIFTDMHLLMMLLVGYLLVFFGFGIEAVLAEKRMRELFETIRRVS